MIESNTTNKDAITCRDYFSRIKYKTLQKRVKKIGIRISTNSNALYNLDHFRGMLIRMSKSKKFSPYGEDLYMDLREAADDPESVRSPTEDRYLKKIERTSI